MIFCCLSIWITMRITHFKNKFRKKIIGQKKSKTPKKVDTNTLDLNLKINKNIFNIFYYFNLYSKVTV